MPEMTFETLAEVMGQDPATFTFSEEQQRVITAPFEPTLVIAGAGAGKTTVMAARAAWLIASGIRPDEILGLTFTEKATAQLAAKLRAVTVQVRQLGFDVADAEPEVYTYDAFAKRLVDDYGLRIGLSQRRLITSPQNVQLAVEVIKSHPELITESLSTSVTSLASRLLHLDSELHNHMVDLEWGEEFFRRDAEKARQAECEYQQILATQRRRKKIPKEIQAVVKTTQQRLDLLPLVRCYRKLKASLGLAEFQDNLTDAVRLALLGEGDNPISQRLRSRFRTVLLDEFQDTSSAQITLLSSLFGDGHSVMAVGDPLQAIYAWRGASTDAMDVFRQAFPKSDGTPSTVLTLSDTWRSGVGVVEVANLISQPLRQNQSEHRLCVPELKSGTGATTTIVASQRRDQNAMLEWLSGNIRRQAVSAIKPDRGGIEPNWKSIAVLCRTNNEVTLCYRHLTDEGIPVAVVGIDGLLLLPEIAEIINMLRLIADPCDDVALISVLTGPRLQFPLASSQALTELIRSASSERDGQKPPSLLEVVFGLNKCRPDTVSSSRTATDLNAYTSLPDQPGLLLDLVLEKLSTLEEEIEYLRRYRHQPLPQLVRTVADLIGVEIEIRQSPAIDDVRVIQYHKFLSVVDSFADISGQSGLEEFLTYIAYADSHDDALEIAATTVPNAVTLSTIHKAKGLEWDTVYLPFLMDGSFPKRVVRDSYLSVAETLPPQLRRDGAIMPKADTYTEESIRRCKDEQTDHLVSEETRLGYVAVTRAKSTLVGLCHQGKAGFEPSPFFDAIYQCAQHVDLEVDEDDSAADGDSDTRNAQWPQLMNEDEWRINRVAETINAALDPAGRLGSMAYPERGPSCDHHWQILLDSIDELTDLDDATRARQWLRAIRHVVDNIKLAREDDGVTIPETVSVSSLAQMETHPDQYLLNLRRPMPIPWNDLALTGTAFHAWVENYYRRGGAADAQYLEPLPDADTNPDVQELIDRFLSSPFAKRQPVAVEVEISLPLGDGKITGKIDAVFQTPSGYEVVDWKTGDGPQNPIQISAYRIAWAQSHNCDLDAVDALYYHVRSGRVERPDKLYSLEELQAVKDKMAEVKLK